MRQESAASADQLRCIFIQSALENRAEIFCFESLGCPIIVQPMKRPYRDRTVRSYRDIWYYARAYREVWTSERAEKSVDGMRDCFIAINELDDVVGLAGGKPLGAHNNEEVWETVGDIRSAYYLAELGRVESARQTRIGTFLFELVILNAIRNDYLSFVLVTAMFDDPWSPSESNPIRSLYERHGFVMMRDQGGEPLGSEFSWTRAGGQDVTDWRPYYCCTADSFLESVGLQ